MVTAVDRLHAVSLFSNCGAGDVGYKKAGFDFQVMAELDPRRLEIAILNHPSAIGVPGDLRQTWREVIYQYRQQVGQARPALLAACPPCQGMSSARSGRGKGSDADAGSKDTRNLLVMVIADVALELQPDAIVVENVAAFLTRNVRHPISNEPISAADLLITELSRDYEVFPILADLCDYGVPQHRKRAFLTFIRKGSSGLRSLILQNHSPYPRPFDLKEYQITPETVSKALKRFKLPSLDSRSKNTATVDGYGGLHAVPVWTERQYAMVSAIPPGSGKSAWENSCCPGCGNVSLGQDDATCTLCGEPLLRPVVQNPDGRYRLVSGFRRTTYRRMPADEPAATITTASGHIGSNLTIHPYENRLLSTLECALLQTFPADFKWGHALTKWGHTNVRAMIGEAVPPLFTELHGLALIGVLTDQWKVAPMSNHDSRCLRARRKLHTLKKRAE